MTRAAPEQHRVAPVAGLDRVVARTAQEPVNTANVGKGPIVWVEVAVVEIEFGRRADQMVPAVSTEYQSL